MDYGKKIKRRLYIYIGYLAIVAIILCAALLFGDESLRDYVIPFFAASSAVGLIRIYDYASMLKDDKKRKKREISERDERNLEIVRRAQSLTFYIYVFASGAAVLVLSILGMGEYMKTVMMSLCFVLVVYYAVYHIMQRRY